MDSKIKSKGMNGLLSRILYGLVGALMLLAVGSLTALPTIGTNTAAIERHSKDITMVEERLLDVATRDDLNRMEDNLKGYIRDLLKTNNGGQ